MFVDGMEQGGRANKKNPRCAFGLLPPEGAFFVLGRPGNKKGTWNNPVPFFTSSRCGWVFYSGDWWVLQGSNL